MGPDLYTIGNLILHMWMQWYWPLPPAVKQAACSQATPD
jgi:hypothetical protein